MTILINALLVSAMCGVGFCTLVRRRTTAKKLWFARPDNPVQKVRVPLFTYVYVVRCWQEHTPPGHEIVMRYALDIPATGQRRGFTSIEALLDTLSLELTNVQEARLYIK